MPEQHRPMTETELEALRRIIGYLHEEEDDYAENPSPDHIWASVKKVIEYSDTFPPEPPEMTGKDFKDQIELVLRAKGHGLL